MVKLIPILIILSSVFSCFGPKVTTPSKKHLNPGLKLTSKFLTDTANMGDIIEIKLCYLNESSDTLVFLPEKILLGHSDPLQSYNTDEVPAVLVGTDIDSVIRQELVPKSDYCITYLIVVSDSLFNLGYNNLNVECFLRKSEERGGIERLDGSLISNEISIYIRRKTSNETR